MNAFTIILVFLVIGLSVLISAQLFGIFTIPNLSSTGTGQSSTGTGTSTATATGTGTTSTATSTGSAILLTNSNFTPFFYGQVAQPGIMNLLDSSTSTNYTPTLSLGGRVDIEFDLAQPKTIKSFQFYQQNLNANGMVIKIDVFSSYPLSVSSALGPLVNTLPGYLQSFNLTTTTAGYQSFTLNTPLVNTSKICLSFYSGSASFIPILPEVQFYGN